MTATTQRPLLVGIAGASASGKSLLAKTIKQRLPIEHIQVISEDSYYFDQSHLTMEEREKTNYDHPNSMEHDLLQQHLEQLKQGNSVNAPCYDFTIHTRKPETVVINPTPIIIIEGIMLFSHKNLRDTFDLKLFVDTPLDICLLRRIKRDTVERGRSLESVIEQYKKTVRPGYVSFIQPTKEYADVIIPKGGKNTVAIDLVETKLKAMC
jgi:uridine kinase